MSNNNLEQPLVSVVMPTYNRERFVGEAIESVLNQTYANLELHVVDDGSKDGTAQLIEKYKSDPRFHYHYQENQGQSVARNRGIRESKGEFICFIDSDNRWFLDKLEKSVPVLSAHKEADILYGNGVTIDENGNEISRHNMPRYSGKITKHLLKDNCISFNTTMIRRSCFIEMGGFNEKDRLAEDYELWLRFSTRYQFIFIPEYLAYYRVMDDQISTDKDRRFWANQRIIEKFISDFPDSLTKQEKNSGLAYFYTRKGRHYAAVGQLRQALSDYCKAMSYTPFSMVPWRALARLLLLRR